MLQESETSLAVSVTESDLHIWANVPESHLCDAPADAADRTEEHGEQSRGQWICI